MERIDILACTVCSRIVDQFTMIPQCKRCSNKYFRLVGATWYTLLCWFLNEPKHVTKLFIEDIREKYHGNKAS